MRRRSGQTGWWTDVPRVPWTLRRQVLQAQLHDQKLLPFPPNRVCQQLGQLFITSWLTSFHPPSIDYLDRRGGNRILFGNWTEERTIPDKENSSIFTNPTWWDFHPHLRTNQLSQSDWLSHIGSDFLLTDHSEVSSKSYQVGLENMRDAKDTEALYFKASNSVMTSFEWCKV